MTHKGRCLAFLAMIGISTIPAITLGQTASHQTGKSDLSIKPDCASFSATESHQKIHQIVARAAKLQALQKAPLRSDQRDNFRSQIDVIVAKEHRCEGQMYLTPQPREN